MNFTTHHYDKRFKDAVNAISPNLSDCLNFASDLPEDAGDRLVAMILELACQCQNVRNIILGREAVAELPPQWLLDRIERVANRILDLDNDDWEYRRFLELSQTLDHQLFTRVIRRGIASTNPEIVEAANDFQSTQCA